MDSAFELLACPARVPLPCSWLSCEGYCTCLQLYTWGDKKLQLLHHQVHGNIGVIFNAGTRTTTTDYAHAVLMCNCTPISIHFDYSRHCKAICEGIVKPNCETQSDFLRCKWLNMPLQGCMLLALILKMCIFVSSDLVFWGLDPWSFSQRLLTYRVGIKTGW